MNSPKSNPFDELDLQINQKAIFQPFSHEAESFTKQKRLDLLTFFVHQGYDMHSIVLDYLIGKVSLDDRNRISEIENSFHFNHWDLVPEGFPDKKWCSAKKMKEIIENYAICLDEDERKPLAESGDLVDFYKRMTQEIEGFVLAAQKVSIPSNLSLRTLIISFVERDTATYKYLSKLWQIDLNVDIAEDIYNRDTAFETDIQNNKYVQSISLGLWSEGGLYVYFMHSILPDLIRGNILYKHPEYDTPATQYMNTLIKKYYPVEDHERLLEDSQFRRKRTLDMAEKAVEILWLNKSYYDDPVYYARSNYPPTDITNKYLPELYDRNLVSICIKNDEEQDINLYNDLKNGIVRKFNPKLNYIHRFHEIVKTINEKDALVINSYLGDFDNKIGLIKKGSEIIELKKDKLTFYCLQMKSVYCTPYPNFWGNPIDTVNLTKYPVLKSLIPQQVTISPIQKNKNKIYSIYYGAPIKIELASMSDESIEIMCTEWLRSDYAPRSFRIEFQLLRTGGNLADIDIIGCNCNNEVTACQVTNTDNHKLINKKAQNLGKTISKRKIMFSHLDTHWESTQNFNQNITEIWNDFKADKTYFNLLERLITS